MVNHETQSKYIIRGGAEGRARLAVISRVLAPSTRELLDRFEPLTGRTVIDAGSGGGDVAFDLATRVGPAGQVVALDRDESKLELARQESAHRGLAHIRFKHADVLAPWPTTGAQLVNMRFVLSHVPDPMVLLRRAADALQPGGFIVVQDVDFGGQFSDPPCPAIEQYRDVYVRTAQHNGGNPFIGPSLGRLLSDSGFHDVESRLVQPYGRSGDVKQVAPLTLAAIGDEAVAAGVVAAEALRRLVRELQAFADDEATTISFPRIFQAWARKP